jgi:PAS domain S-box-containing protein
MNSLPLPESFSEQDLHLLRHLVLLASGPAPVETVLAELQEHFKPYPVSLRRYSDLMPDAARLVVIPLMLHDQHMGDLCCALPPDVDGIEVAAKLSFLTPALTLALGADMLGRERTLCVQVYEERDRLESVLEATTDAILMIDDNGTVVMMTAQFETFTGVPRYEFLGASIESLAERVGSDMANVLRALANNAVESLGGMFEILRPQHRILNWHSLRVYSRSGMVLGRIFAFRDTTRERELDRMKADFVSLVSHELRTPLTSVKGFSDLLLEKDLGALDPDIADFVSIIGLNADRLITLLNDILDITRIETDRVDFKPDLCSIPDVIEQVVASLQPLVNERRHILRIDIEPSLPPGWADSNRMVQILTNLITNAIKYTLHPGEITIRTRFISQLSDLPSQATRDQILPCVLVSVQDTGLGIAPNDYENVFKRFYRARTPAMRAVSGTGLGLTIVKSFVEMQGGQVWFESELGVGSTFFFTVPVVESKTHASGV